jgi:hypothetical protein
MNCEWLVSWQEVKLTIKKWWRYHNPNGYALCSAIARWIRLDVKGAENMLLEVEDEVSLRLQIF